MPATRASLQALRPGFGGFLLQRAGCIALVADHERAVLLANDATGPVETEQGKPIAHAVNFTGHATMTDSKTRKFSADYPGAAVLAEAVLVPVVPSYGPRELGFILRESRARILVPQSPYRPPKRSRGELMSWLSARPPAGRMLWPYWWANCPRNSRYPSCLCNTCRSYLPAC
jgi:hypothetical protein